MDPMRYLIELQRISHWKFLGSQGPSAFVKDTIDTREQHQVSSAALRMSFPSICLEVGLTLTFLTFAREPGGLASETRKQLVALSHNQP